MNKLLYNNRFLYRGSRHILFFCFTVLCFSVILYVQNGSENFSHTFGVTFSNALFFFGYAYITIFLLIPEFLLKGKILWFLLLLLLIGVGLSAIKLVTSDFIFYSSIAPENVERTGVMNLRFIVVNTKDMTFIVALFCITKYVKDYLFAENQRKMLEKQNKEAQSTLLQSQFDPHFMFNTINNLYALSLLNPVKTNEVIRRMKIVLSYIIEESRKNLVWLSDEVELVENYISLEQLRYGKRLKVEFVTHGNIEALKIPPMVLFLLVENSFKHGSSLDAGTPWIKIDVRAESGKITLSAENSKPKTILKHDFDIEKGRGFKSLKKRLDIIYQPQGYQLKIEEQDVFFKVLLELKENIEFRQTTYR
ncbi:histidine kinase [Prolixibacteraceae bacterium Z1-6]|uniref:Histidine kinase n=1 Tax=Draconibacterium aestuarii TaxID=2998507 RepID=A0A9X3FBN6_9BACT|nr:histidine kinase [Prolixibacteraceae bacterium Z1-6]